MRTNIPGNAQGVLVPTLYFYLFFQQYFPCLICLECFVSFGKPTPSDILRSESACQSQILEVKPVIAVLSFPRRHFIYFFHEFTQAKVWVFLRNPDNFQEPRHKEFMLRRWEFALLERRS